MAIQTAVEYGNRLYSQPTYSSNQDPQTFLVSLSDTTSISESLADSINSILADLLTLVDAKVVSNKKVLSDTVTSADTLIASAAHPLADSVALSEARIISAVKVFADALASLDALSIQANAALAETLFLTDAKLISAVKRLTDTLGVKDPLLTKLGKKVLTDFIVLNEWIAIKLQRGGIWTDSSPSSASWATSPLDPAVWAITSASEKKDKVFPLYSLVLYGKVLYGTNQKVEWKANAPSTISGWTNHDDSDIS